MSRTSSIDSTNNNQNEDFDENKRDFELLSQRRLTPPADGTSVSPSPSPSGSDVGSSRVGTNDMIWPLHLTPIFVDHYIIGDVIGNGSYAEVRECVDTRTLERCALKIVNKSYLKRQAPRALANQLQEIRLLRHLEHPSVITMKECLFKGNHIYIALEHCSFNLDELLNDQADRSFHVAMARPLFLQLCWAVSYLHSIGIVHRDIKPQNMLLTNNGTLKLIDFGVSQVLSLWSAQDLCTNYEGSPLFQAPEVVSGQKEYHGFKVDIWSCGVTLYLMLYGQYPFMDEALLGLYDKILAEDLVIPASLASGGNGGSHLTSLSLIDLLASMLEKDNSKRASIEQVLESPWCKLTTSGDCDGELDLPLQHSEFFDFVTRRNNHDKSTAHVDYATSQHRDMYKSMSCLPYLYQHHFPELPLTRSRRQSSSRRNSCASDQSAIIERINLISSRSSSCSSSANSSLDESSETTSQSADTSPSSTRSSAETSSPSTHTVEEEIDEAFTGQIEWGTREQYHLMKVPQVRPNRIRYGASSKRSRRRARRRESRRERERTQDENR